MKFNCHVDIKLPLEKTVELWNDPANLKHWQDGFVGLEHLSGEPGKKGAKSKMIAKFMPGIFRKQTEKWLNQFRDFAEQHQ